MNMTGKRNVGAILASQGHFDANILVGRPLKKGVNPIIPTNGLSRESNQSCLFQVRHLLGIQPRGT